MMNFTYLYRTPFSALALVLALLIQFSLSMASDAQEDDRPTIVVLGDSLVAGYQLPPGAGFPEKLQAVLDAKGAQIRIIGAGVSGDTSSGGLARLDWSVPEGTDAVLLELGANDALRGLPPQITRENLEAIILRLKDRGIEIVLAGMLAPPNMGEDYAAAFNVIYPELAAKYQIPLYPFFLEGVTAQPDMLLEDAMHPNERGVEVIVGKILPIIEKLTEKLRPIP